MKNSTFEVRLTVIVVDSITINLTRLSKKTSIVITSIILMKNMKSSPIPWKTNNSNNVDFNRKSNNKKENAILEIWSLNSKMTK